MKVVSPSALVREAADVILPVREHVVVVRASALQIALADTEALLTPTADIDFVVKAEAAEPVVATLEKAAWS